ncbi:MAG: HlyC/CorC family transporter [Rhodobiaceae bacterium]|nr:HlyC/CorC family transporter [Rhodobiaceae bacterium]MCC0055378.1 HlyC/CorC family transporter [Rhodobiaceae bacterium]
MNGEPDKESGNAATRDEGGFFSWLQGVFGDRNHSVRESIEDALDEEGTSADHLTPKERTMLRNILDLRHRRVEDVMVPRADVVAIEAQASLDSIIQLFQKGGHSRLPVYRETLDDPLGMVHIKDLMTYLAANAIAGKGSRSRKNAAGEAPAFDLKRVDLSATVGKAGLTREILYVPPSMPVGDLMVKMQTTRIHMALVVDEYGGTDGLVSIEDVVEEVVGEIEDEHDEQTSPQIVAVGAGVFIADARASIEDLHAALGHKIVPEDILEEVDTIGGLVFHRAGRVPVRGEVVRITEDFEFEILDADPRRIKRVKILPGDRPEARKSRRRRPPTPETAD